MYLLEQSLIFHFDSLDSGKWHCSSSFVFIILDGRRLEVGFA